MHRDVSRVREGDLRLHGPMPSGFICNLYDLSAADGCLQIGRRRDLLSGLRLRRRLLELRYDLRSVYRNGDSANDDVSLAQGALFATRHGTFLRISTMPFALTRAGTTMAALLLCAAFPACGRAPLDEPFPDVRDILPVA